ncbi:MAG: hypothetical protein M9891_11730, partial [Austwickia sp.]|nr:hypothetical protein [Austwickia sp.]
ATSAADARPDHHRRMHARHRLTDAGRALARMQAGVLSTPQLLRLGYTERSLERASRDWTRLARGVYLLTDLTGKPAWEALVWAGVLLGGEGACAAGTAAEAVTWLSRACQRRLTTEKRLVARLHDRPTVRHAALLRTVLGDIGAGATTELERRVMHDVFRAHGLPEGKRQVRSRSRGRIVDILVKEYALVVELDGKIGHVEEGAFRDRRRDNANTIGGRWSLRYGWHEACGYPCECAIEIGQALRDRGWRGEFRTCRRCAL